MNFLRPRPPFERAIAAPPAAVIAALRGSLSGSGGRCEGAVSPRHFVLRVPYQQRHVWSPVLDANVREEDGRTRLVGRFGPHPNVWTLFVFLRACLLVALTATSVFACSQTLVHGGSPFWKWALAAALLVVVEYVGASAGQRLGHDQIALLERFVDDALGSVSDAAATSDAPPASQ